MFSHPTLPILGTQGLAIALLKLVCWAELDIHRLGDVAWAKAFVLLIEEAFRRCLDVKSVVPDELAAVLACVVLGRPLLFTSARR